ncbi:MAG: sterol desaturase family protein [Pseudomonadales bacterium]|nr:sterol desaturase family protein [Pseudomonadales bacterium]
MADYIITHQTSLLTYSLWLSFILALLWEILRPWIKTSYSRPVRWWNTLGLYLLNQYFIHWLMPVTTITAAIYAAKHSIGLFNLLSFDSWFGVLVGFLFFDLYHFSLHWTYHKVPLLWRFHRLHHSDPDVDLSTELKHHPFEGIVSAVLSVAFIMVLGIHPIAIILRVLINQMVSLISHANIKLPQHIDTPVRKVLVTPAMHRIHHSSWRPETNSNYGTLFSFWDRIFGTYMNKPRDGYERMELGLDSFRSPRELWLDQLLLQPFRRTPTKTIPGDQITD